MDEEHDTDQWAALPSGGQAKRGASGLRCCPGSPSWAAPGAGRGRLESRGEGGGQLKVPQDGRSPSIECYSYTQC